MGIFSMMLFFFFFLSIKVQVDSEGGFFSVSLALDAGNLNPEYLSRRQAFIGSTSGASTVFYCAAYLLIKLITRPHNQYGTQSHFIEPQPRHSRHKFDTPSGTINLEMG